MGMNGRRGRGGGGDGRYFVVVEKDEWTLIRGTETITQSWMTQLESGRHPGPLPTWPACLPACLPAILYRKDQWYVRHPFKKQGSGEVEKKFPRAAGWGWEGMNRAQVNLITYSIWWDMNESRMKASGLLKWFAINMPKEKKNNLQLKSSDCYALIVDSSCTALLFILWLLIISEWKMTWLSNKKYTCSLF